MVQLIDGRAIAERVKDGIAQTVFSFQGQHPNLAIILVGDREDSRLYVSLKEKEGKKLGIDTHLYIFEADAAEDELLSAIDFLNNDELIDGILVQLPLPSGFNTDKIIKAIDPLKDVDGFHPDHPDYVISPVLAGVTASLDEIKLEGPGKTACLLYNSPIFGAGLEKVLQDRGWTILGRERLAAADLVVSALGEPRSLKKEMVKEGAALIDVGITKVDGKVYGDADFEDLKDRISYITPVPGGIGPMTIAFLFKNVLEVFQRRHGLMK